MKNNKNQLIYVVDDDRPLNVMICKFLRKEGFLNVEGFFTGEELFTALKKDTAPIIIQDFDLPGINGLEILSRVKNEFPKSEFIFLSGQSKIDIAVDAIKNGAFDYVIKDSFAKENVYNKIRNLIRIKKLVYERKLFVSGMIVAAVLLFATWLILSIKFLGS